MFFFFNDTATTEIYTLSLHDALPISGLAGILKIKNPAVLKKPAHNADDTDIFAQAGHFWPQTTRSEEHTSELQSQSNLVCRLLLEKKKKNTWQPTHVHRDSHMSCGDV